MADEDKLSWRKISTDPVYKTRKTHTKYAHIIHGRPTLKDIERFRNGSVCEPYEISLYEQTFMSEPFIEKHALSTEYGRSSPSKIQGSQIDQQIQGWSKDQPCMDRIANKGMAWPNSRRFSFPS